LGFDTGGAAKECAGTPDDEAIRIAAKIAKLPPRLQQGE
jgi:hypothetical protein